jgi:UDP:flavonoid glycosyltransferase YjiC (YdhE family)
MSTVLLVALGRAGDVHPIVGLGLAPRTRGHRVKVLTHGYYEVLVRGAGLEYDGIATTEEFLEISRDPDLVKPHVAIRRLGEQATLERTCELIEETLGKRGGSRSPGPQRRDRVGRGVTGGYGACARTGS